jgi:ATP-dependent helicase HrpA
MTDIIKQLPIYEKKDDILSQLKKNQVIIVAGETGSGKTTQLPKFFHELGYTKNKKIAVTQPRRIAATSTATRVASELNSEIGNLVGYKIRFHSKTSEKSQILFMTDGILLNEINSDPLLKKYSLIMIDEAHERSLNIDFLLGYLKKLLPKRKDLKIVISSATIDTDRFSKFFNNAPITNVSGRLFPVEIIYQENDHNSDYIKPVLNAVEDIITMNEPGDILIFMPTEKDITETVNKLSGALKDTCVILPLFARLTKDQQNRVFKNVGQRKIVVSTNVAETSLTVPGIRFVIDTGLARIKRYSAKLRTNRLPIDFISKASADQRKGRCGRVAEGICIRLFSQDEFIEFRDFESPEIKRSNLAGVVLYMKTLPIGSPEDFPFIEPPEKTAFTDAYNQLRELGAVNKKRELTALGKKMARMPLEPHISRMILEAAKQKTIYEVAIIAAGLSIVDPRERPDEYKDKADLAHKQFLNNESDFMSEEIEEIIKQK